LRDPKFRYFDRTPASDEQTDGMRDGHSTYCTSIASRGKKTNPKFDSVEYYSI